MTDEQRADWLARSLEGRPPDAMQGPSEPPAPDPDGEGVPVGDESRGAGLQRGTAREGPGMPDDPELAELLALACRLQALGPSMALIAQAEAAFDPAFSRRLKGAVLAAHPTTFDAGVPAGQSGVACALERDGIPRTVAPERSATAASGLPPLPIRGRNSRAWDALRARVRSLRAIILLAALAIAVTMLYALNHATPPPQRAAAGATATITPGPAVAHYDALRSPSARSNSSPPGLHATPTAGTPPMAAVQMPSGTAVLGSASQPPAASVDPRPLQDFGFYTAGSSLPMAQRHASARTIPVHYRAAPHLSATAPRYALSYRTLSARTVEQIVASFPSLRRGTPIPIVLGGLKALRYVGGAETLDIVPVTGDVRYSQRLPAVGGTFSAAAAPAVAARWLAAHTLSPPATAARTSVVTVAGGLREVRLVPALPHPLQNRFAASTAIGVRVRLDGVGRVVAAERLWPSLLARSAAALPTLPRSIAVPILVPRGAAGAPPSGHVAASPSSFEVARVAIVYTVQGTPPTARLSPGYLLQGRLVGPGGASRPYSVVFAGNPAP